jgi:hypothetical protein
MRFIHTKVQTKDHDRHPTWPVKIEVDGEMADVDEVVDRWMSAGKDSTSYPSEYWKVRAAGRKYIVMYNTLFDSWWLKETEI